VLAVVVASLLEAGAGWCDAECFERAHPVLTRWPFGKLFGGPEAQYGFSLSTSRRERVHRFQLGWAAPAGPTLEVLAALAFTSEERFEVVPGVRYSPFKLGALLVPALAVTAALSWSAGALELRVRQALEVHVGMAAMSLALELDAGGVAGPRVWWNVLVGI
jgi:hypothetical protein